MTAIRSIVSRIAALFRRRELDERIDDEMRFHVEMETEQNMRRGMSEREARRQALIESGGVEQVKEAHRDIRGLPFLESLIQDLRFALRSFRRDPGFTATVLVTLALGIGVGTAVFSVVNALLLQPLPYEDPDRLVTLWRVNDRDADGTRTPLSSADFNDWLVSTKAVEVGYLYPDCDLDGQVTASDFNLWLSNTKAVAASQVPD